MSEIEEKRKELEKEAIGCSGMFENGIFAGFNLGVQMARKEIFQICRLQHKPISEPAIISGENEDIRKTGSGSTTLPNGSGLPLNSPNTGLTNNVQLLSGSKGLADEGYRQREHRKTLEHELDYLFSELLRVRSRHPMFNHFKNSYHERQANYFEKYGHWYEARKLKRVRGEYLLN